MGKIELTNIIIDDFSIAKRQTNKIFTHILTHIHTDHLKGLVDGWSYGPIYCTQITKQLVLQKYPGIKCIHVLELEKPTVIKISPTLDVTVTLFDANHCFGAVMVLLEGYMGTILYTGDFRFDKQVFQNYNLLYPPEIRNEELVDCSKKIDLLYLDNTFLKKKFNFPKKAVVQEMTLDFIKQLLQLNQHTRIYIALDIYGKQQIIEYVAKQLDIYIVVDEIRYDILRAMGRDLQLYTTNFDEGFIQIITKRRMHEYLEKDKQSICFILTGWANQPSYRNNKRIYCLPYSLHSNYQEIHAFVNSIRPSYIEPIVFKYPQEDRIFFAGDREFDKRMLVFEEEELREEQKGYYYELEQLRKLYCSPPSQEYRILMSDFQLQKSIMQKLLPPKMLQFSQDQKQMMPIHLQTVQRKKYKLKNQRNQAQINRIRNQILLKKKMIEGERIQIIQDEDIDESAKRSEIVIEQSLQNLPQRVNMLEDQINIISPEIVQLDPFDPFIRTNKLPKKRSSTKNNQQISPFNKSAQQKFLEKVRRKLKQQQHKPQLEHGVPQSNPFLKSNPKPKEISQSKKMPISWITSINIDNLNSFKMLRAEQQLKNFFQNNKKAVDFISSRLSTITNK